MFFRKTEDISARKFAPIIYSSHVPHTSRTSGCKQAVSGPSWHNISNVLFNVEWQDESQ